MKIGIFAYNFSHWKTQQGITNLAISGVKPEVIFAADRVNLNFYKSKIRTSPKDLHLVHPKDIASHYKIDYKIVTHNSEEVYNITKERGLDLGIILGARILKPIAFRGFKKGVLNMHPGILPENRGLDTIKWAIIKNMPQGVTTHLINEKIDRGLLVEKELIKVYKDDTLLDLQIRIQNLEQKLMLSSIKILNEKSSTNGLKNILEGSYNKSMSPDIERELFHKFGKYKEKFGI
tara:strand:+ start:4091 stop:4792 length:702 start_codon:yes stop_codon:yes gene_type:complete